MDERRKEQRYLYQTLVKYAEENNYENLNAVSLNISSEGISILSDVEAAIGDEFTLKFKLMDYTNPILAKCKVIYSEPHQGQTLIGCKLTDLDGISRDELAIILDKTFNMIDFIN